MERFVLFNKLKRLGRSFALDTETALIPYAFNGKGSVRLIQFWSPKYAFHVDTFNLTASDWTTLTVIPRTTIYGYYLNVSLMSKQKSTTP